MPDTVGFLLFLLHLINPGVTRVGIYSEVTRVGIYTQE